jgi:hypothetical protein
MRSEEPFHTNIGLWFSYPKGRRSHFIRRSEEPFHTKVGWPPDDPRMTPGWPLDDPWMTPGWPLDDPQMIPSCKTESSTIQRAQHEQPHQILHWARQVHGSCSESCILTVFVWVYSCSCNLSDRSFFARNFRLTYFRLFRFQKQIGMQTLQKYVWRCWNQLQPIGQVAFRADVFMFVIFLLPLINIV